MNRFAGFYETHFLEPRGGYAEAELAIAKEAAEEIANKEWATAFDAGRRLGRAEANHLLLACGVIVGLIVGWRLF